MSVNDASLSYSQRLSVLHQKLDAFKADDEAQEEDSRREHVHFIGILRDACTIVRDAEASGASPDTLDDVITQVDSLIHSAVEFGYGDSELFDFIPSFAHSPQYPEVKDQTEACFRGLSYGDFGGLLQLLNMFSNRPVTRGDLPQPPRAWSAEMKPHALTSPLARFRSDLPQLTATEAHPLANIIYQARCEIVSNDICSPTHLSISSGYSCVAVLTAGGYKNRVPALTYFLPTDGVDKDFEEYDVNVGLAGLAYHGFVSEERRLIFAADTDRIKSYAWASGDSAAYEKALPTHTLDSNLWHGPLTILSDGRLLRAGTGSAAFWDLDTVGTHGPKGRNRIGKRIDVEDTWRDDPEEIETSHGSAPTGRIEFHDSAMAVGAWHPHPSSSGVMLCAPKDTYACVTLDLVHGGKTGARYIGHGGNVEDFSTSGMDVNVFATAGSDGCARLYDVRHPLPVLTFDAGRVSEACSSVILTHPDGIPTLFTGGERSEQIKVWDVRARSAVYELATGNNSVHRIVWDAKRTTLYAVTECVYMDRMGYHHDYRKAKIPDLRSAEEKAEEEKEVIADEGAVDEVDDEEEDEDDYEDEEEGEEEEESDDDDDDEYGRNWPSRAFHRENHFGYAFDAGNHRIYRYDFKANPDLSVLPPYGNASRGEPGLSW